VESFPGRGTAFVVYIPGIEPDGPGASGHQRP